MDGMGWTDGSSDMKTYSVFWSRIGMAVGGFLGAIFGVVGFFIFAILAEIPRIPLLFIFGAGVAGFIVGGIILGLVGAMMDKATDRKQ